MLVFNDTLEDFFAFCEDESRQSTLKKRDWYPLHSFINSHVEDIEERKRLHKKLNVLQKQRKRETRQEYEKFLNFSKHVSKNEPTAPVSFVKDPRFEIIKFEQFDPSCITVKQLDELAFLVENSRLPLEEKLQYLTRLDRLFIQRKAAKGLQGKSKGYCHNYKIKIHMASEETKGYGSLCIGHSRSAYKFTGL